MDIHRSRFVAYPSSPINTLAFSRTNDKTKAALKLALGRANGDIEIWNADKGNWVQEVVFPSNDDRSVDALAWIQEPDDTDYEGKPIIGQLRLFSIGSTPAVTEWNLSTGLVERASTGNFSEVWCFAAQPHWRPSKDKKEVEGEFRGQNLVVGCGDGSLAVLSTAENDLVFQRFLARSGSRKARCMSVTWQNRNTVVAGFTDSTIRIFDVRSGSMIRSMSLGAGVPGSPRDSLVWRLKCLPNGNIVSADSNGEVRIWDGRTYSLSQRLVGHESDCLELVTSTDGQTIFSGGMDGRIAVYKLGSKETADKKGRWAKTSHRRMHEGDIKAMAVYDSKDMSVVISGGECFCNYHVSTHPTDMLQDSIPLPSSLLSVALVKSFTADYLVYRIRPYVSALRVSVYSLLGGTVKSVFGASTSKLLRLLPFQKTNLAS